MKRARWMRAWARKMLAAGLCCACTGPLTWAQQQLPIDTEKPQGFIFIRPYKPAYAPPVRPGNSRRLNDLVRGGRIYLTVQDAIALTLENNIDLEIDRYNPLIDTWNLERAQAGGALPGVPSGTSQANSVATGQGVAGSQAAAGVSTSGGGNSSSNAVGATISQIGPVTPTLDPVVQSTASYTHKSAPQANVVQTETYNWIQDKRNYTESISQGLITGGQVSLTYNDSYLNENVPSDLLNPSSGTVLQLQVQHNFLQGFGIAVNSRTITVAKLNLRLDDLTFENEVMGAVANTLNLYYGLVADYEDIRAKRSALEVARQFFENNKKQVQIGTMAPLDVTTAEAQVASSQQDLVVSQTTLEEAQISLKNALSRNGMADPVVAEADVIPLDRIVVPEKDDLPPVKAMLATALQNRVDLQGEKFNLQNLQTSALGTANTLLPRLAGLATLTTQGVAGQAQAVPVGGTAPTGTGGAGVSPPVPPGYIRCPPGKGATGQICEYPDSYFVGGIGTALGQLIRRNFPSESAGAYFAPTLRNRQAQADFAIDRLSMRQSELQTGKDFNQLAVDVSNQSIALQQARVRYQAAVHNRILEQELLDAEQKKFALGASTTFNVVQQQRDLATAQSSEVASLVTYSNARVALDQTLGLTLKTNHVSLDEAKAGRVARPSVLPNKLPDEK